MAFLPFSPKAKAWEPVAMDLRRLGKVDDGELPDPEVLAEKVGLYMVDARFALEDFDEADRSHLLVRASGSWSGGVYPVPLPDADTSVS